MSDSAQELLSSQTITQSDIAFWMAVKDIIKASYSIAHFEQYVNKLKTAAGEKISSNSLDKVVEMVFLPLCSFVRYFVTLCV